MRPVRPKRQFRELPQFYYHAHFTDLLDFVETRYEHCFRDQDRAFVKSFHSLPFPAQCLFIRLAGRKGLIFDLRKLNYPEIDNLDLHIGELREVGLIRDVSDSQFYRWLEHLTKPDLCQVLDNASIPILFRSSWNKARLIELAQTELDPAHVVIPDHFVEQQAAEVLNYLSFLYFGRLETNLQRFTLRDLGITKTPNFKADYSARFDSLEDAMSTYFYAKALRTAKRGTEDALTDLIDDIEQWPAPCSDTASDLRGRLLFKLGKLCERLEDHDLALDLYERSDTPDCNERSVRIRYARGEKADVETRLKALIDNPGSEAELNFATDFYARKYKKKRTSAFTDLLRSGETIVIDEVFKDQTEQAVIHRLGHDQIQAFHSENALWRMLFGLLFWPLLFGDKAKALHSSFDRLPASLKAGRFYDDHEVEIERILSDLNSPACLKIRILKTFTRHHGHPNGIFRWSDPLFDLVQALIKQAPPQSFSTILRLMCQKYRDMRDGFPDLICISESGIKFIEVKAEGDVLRKNQLTRIKQMRDAGISTEILRVEWAVDPAQDYVVIDVETTGGRAAAHRITEIGAVKLRGGRIVDEFQTLINPQRTIPPFITGLTGITQDMVADAPKFEDIAEELAAFMSGSIFVAHNVNFDYGFIKQEFNRLGRHFSRPKVCSCASMRRHFPGLKSYSLKNLCRAFDISLDQHHRALCDAKAAAELLTLVHEKRAQA